MTMAQGYQFPRLEIRGTLQSKRLRLPQLRQGVAGSHLCPNLPTLPLQSANATQSPVRAPPVDQVEVAQASITSPQPTLPPDEGVVTDAAHTDVAPPTPESPSSPESSPETAMPLPPPPPPESPEPSSSPRLAKPPPNVTLPDADTEDSDPENLSQKEEKDERRVSWRPELEDVRLISPISQPSPNAEDAETAEGGKEEDLLDEVDDLLDDDDEDDDDEAQKLEVSTGEPELLEDDDLEDTEDWEEVAPGAENETEAETSGELAEEVEPADKPRTEAAASVESLPDTPGPLEVGGGAGEGAEPESPGACASHPASPPLAQSSPSSQDAAFALAGRWQFEGGSGGMLELNVGEGYRLQGFLQAKQAGALAGDARLAPVLRGGTRKEDLQMKLLHGEGGDTFRGWYWAKEDTSMGCLWDASCDGPTALPFIADWDVKDLGEDTMVQLHLEDNEGRIEGQLIIPEEEGGVKVQGTASVPIPVATMSLDGTTEVILVMDDDGDGALHIWIASCGGAAEGSIHVATRGADVDFIP